MITEHIPYSLKADPVISVLLLVCFFISSSVLAGNKKYLIQQGRNYLFHKERTSLFVPTTSLNGYSSWLLILQYCLLVAVVLFAWFNYQCQEFIPKIHSGILLIVYTFATMFFIYLKRILYLFLGWLFYEKSPAPLWIDSYFTLLYFLGFILFPYALVLVFFDFGAEVLLIFSLVILIIAKILMLYKWLKFFFNNIYGLSLLILYFCALEIVPCFLFYKALLDISNLLLIKY